MRELALRLRALDPGVSQTLQVVGYFDALVARQASAQAMVRGAAALAGCPAGCASGGRILARSAPDGSPLAPERPRVHVAQTTGAGDVVWLERDALGETDAVVLERLALAVGIARARGEATRTPRSPVAVLLDARAPGDERAAALLRLGLDEDRTVTVVATAADRADRRRSDSSDVLATPHGLVRADICSGTGEAALHGGRAGVGPTAPVRELPHSWADALVALRLATAQRPVVRSAELGALVRLAQADDPAAPPHPDVAVLRTLAASDLASLDAVQQAGAVRAAATALGLHHSTVQARVRRACAMLGYDASSPDGRLRYGAARLLHRLRDDPAAR